MSQSHPLKVTAGTSDSLGLSVEDNIHDVMIYDDRHKRKKQPVKIYFMLVQGRVFHNPFLLQTHSREAQQMSKLQDTGAWLAQTAT